MLLPFPPVTTVKHREWVCEVAWQQQTNTMDVTKKTEARRASDVTTDEHRGWGMVATDE